MMEEKIKAIIELRDKRLEEAKKETEEKFQFAGFCAVNALNQALDILGVENAVEDISDAELDDLINSIDK